METINQARVYGMKEPKDAAFSLRFAQRDPLVEYLVSVFDEECGEVLVSFEIEFHFHVPFIGGFGASDQNIASAFWTQGFSDPI